MKKQKIRLSISSHITFLIWIIVIGIIGVSLPPTINFVNGLEEGAFYGYLASYWIVLLLFWAVKDNWKFTTIRKSVFEKFSLFWKKYCMRCEE